MCIRDSRATGIALFRQDAAGPSIGARVYGNTVFNPDNGRWCLNVVNGSTTGTEVFGNILINLHSWRGVICIDALDSFKSDYNLIIGSFSVDGCNSTISFSEWQDLGFDQNSIEGGDLDTIFKDVANNNYELVSGSPVIDAGTDSINSLVQDDLEGIERPQGDGFDIGCYEYPIISGIQAGQHLPLENTYVLKGNTIYFLNLSEGGHIKISDLSGKLIKSDIYSPNEVYVFENYNYSSGVYVFTLLSDSGQLLGSGKIVILK